MSPLDTTEKEIDEECDKRNKKLIKKYPNFGYEYLIGLHKILDWREKQLKKLIKKLIGEIIKN